MRGRLGHADLMFSSFEIGVDRDGNLVISYFPAKHVSKTNAGKLNQRIDRKPINIYADPSHLCLDFHVIFEELCRRRPNDVATSYLQCKSVKRSKYPVKDGVPVCYSTDFTKGPMGVNNMS
jgi:hypothetical protein